MKEQYLVQVKQKYNPDSWFNANLWMGNGFRRYCNTLEEAKRCIDHAYELWNGERLYDSKGERVDSKGAIPIVCTKETDDRMRIIAHRIRKRYVSKWENVNE